MRYEESTFLNKEASCEHGPLSRFVVLRSGNFIDNAIVSDNGRYPVFGANGQIGWTDCSNYSGVEVAVGRVGSCGAITVVEEPAWITDNTIVLQPSESVDPMYLAYALRVKDLRSLASSSIQPLLTQKVLAAVEMCIPPLSEQKRIAAKLDEQMATLASAQAALATQREAATALRSAVLRAALDPATHPEWRLAKLHEAISDAQSGFASGERDEHGIVQLRMNNVTSNGLLNWNATLRVPTTDTIVDRYRLVPGDVLFNNTNSTDLVGKSAMFAGYKEPVVFSNHFTRLRTDRTILDPTFLSNWLLYLWSQRVFKDICNRWIGQSAVKPETLLALDIPLPSLPEQCRVAKRLDSSKTQVDALVASLDDQATTLDSLRTSLLDAAFSGQV